MTADWDGDLEDTATCLETLTELGGFALASGTEGHLQCFLPLVEPITMAERFTLLCKACQAYLPEGSDKGKNSWNDIWRIPGTLNHKPTVRPGDTGQPAPVTWALEPTGARRSLAELEQTFGLRPRTIPVAVTLSEPVDLTAVLASVDLAALDLAAVLRDSVLKSDGTVDRSETIMAVTGKCVDAGLTDGQTQAVVSLRPDLLSKYQSRADGAAYVKTCYDKAIRHRQVRVRQRLDEQEWLKQYPMRGAAKPETPSGTASLLSGSLTAAELDAMQFADLVQHVPFLVTEGLGIIAGPPKAGKSWLT